MRITELKKIRGQQYRVTLEDHESEFVTVDAATLEESGYREGSFLDEEMLGELIKRSEKNRARSRALYYLSGRDYAAKELERKLTRCADREVAAEVVGRLTEVGLINDFEYARRLARDLQQYRHYPRRRILQELYGRGIGREEAAEAVAELEEEDLKQALALIRKKYYNKLSDRAARDKTAAALARYGFDYDTVRRAIRAAAESAGEENETDYGY